MENVPIIIIGILSIGFVLFLIKKVTGIVFRVIALVLLAAFLYYLYQSGVHEIIMAPGAPESETIVSSIML